MISDDELIRKVSEIEGLVESPRDLGSSRLPIHDSRIDRIVEKAMYENLLKDTAGFLFNSVGTALMGLTAAVMGHPGGAPNLPRSSSLISQAEVGEDSDPSSPYDRQTVRPES